jgi:hypothetical protein
VTDASWQDELQRLRVDLGELRPMRMRWRWRRTLQSNAWPPLNLRPLFARTLTLALYPEAALPGDHPVVEFDVDAADGYLSTLEQPRDAVIAGTPLPGHAAVVVVDGHQYWPIYPGQLRTRAQRL